VAQRWKETGEWSEHEDEKSPGWKWKHESPSPEPEKDIDDPQYTPSEVDALDAISPATPPSSVRGYEDAVDF
jgi:hypothetical protein